MADSFTHLHLHTEFSMLDGAARVKDVVAAAVADGQPAIGITDHGNMYGVLDFYKACRKEGIKPVIGTEAYMAKESRHERPQLRGRMDDNGGEAEGGEKPYYHLTLLAETTAGYRNLIKLSSDAFMTGYWRKPRCLVAGTEIVTDTGVKAIEDIEVGDRVLTHLGRLRPVTQVMSRRHQGRLYGVKLNNRYPRVVWMTGEHPVLARDQTGAVRWVPVDEIEAGRSANYEAMSTWRSFACLPKIEPDEALWEIAAVDYLPAEWTYNGTHFVKETMRSRRGATRHYGEFPATLQLDHELGVLVGLYAAEGATYGAEIRWSLHEDEHHLVDAIRLGVKRLTRKDVAVHQRPARPGYRGIEVRVCSWVLAALLKQWCGTGSNDKHLPDFSFDANGEFRRGLFEGVVAGDGSGYPSNTSFTSTSAALAWQVRLLGAELTDSMPGVRTSWDGHPAHAPAHTLNFATADKYQYRRTLADADYVYRPILEVLERDTDEMVFNIEVEEDHSYVSDFAIHNCDWDMLAEHHEGLIATTGCLGGVVLQAMLRGDQEGAIKLAGRLQDIFGRDSLFVELQDHGLPEQRKTNPQLVELAKAIRAPLLATNDSHYVHREDSVSHDALLCVQTGSSIDDPKRFKFEGDEHYLKTAAEMRSLFAEVPSACDNTLWIAERADVEIEFGRAELPVFPLPEGFADDDAYLRDLVLRGAEQRYGAPIPGDVMERVDMELGVIGSMGFSTYFLVVWDLIKHARDSGIRCGPGRGSAAGCCVSYCLRITDLDPLKYGLIFERFLDPSRKEMPDIDMDFDERYRGDLIRYCSDMYGSDRVAQIITFSTIKARAAVRDAARVLGYPYALGDRIAKAMPPLVMGKDTPLWACFDPTPEYHDGYKVATELREIYETDSDAKRVIDIAKGLEGLRRQDSIHAAAVVITRDPLTEYLPIQRKPDPGGKPEDSPVVTQYEMHGVQDDLGLLKMDFLGLRNLSVIERALDLIESVTGERPDIDNVALDDRKVYEMLSRGDSMGVFQLEGGPMRALMRSLAPDSFEDIGALVALYRPGPMAANMHNDFADRKNGRQEKTYLHEDLAEVLSETQGLMIYQESLMQVARKFAGYSMADAGRLRKACAKKIREQMAAEKASFVDGCETTGYGRELGEKLWAQIEPFADYAFPKAHSYCYGFIAYQTAWLKANHPVEYLAALLTSVRDDKDKTAVYLAECRAMGISVLVPDVNTSASDFTSVEGAIPFGLSAIRNVGEGLVGHIVTERNANGPFKDFYDYCERVDLSVLNKKAIESLIKAGAFDSMDHPRKGLCLVFEQIVDRMVARRREREAGVLSLFGDVETGGDEPGFDDARVPVPDVEFERAQRLAFEKEMLGLYLSDHPLMGAEASLRKHTTTTINELRESRDGEVQTVGGVVTSLSRKYTKRGDLMATFVLEDLASAIETWVFPRTMLEYGSLLADDVVVAVKGRLDTREDEPKLIVLEIKRPEIVQDGGQPLRIKVALESFSDAKAEELRTVLRRHPGPSPVFLHVGGKVLRLPEAFNVDGSNGLVAELRILLGTTCLL